MSCTTVAYTPRSHRLPPDRFRHAAGVVRQMNALSMLTGRTCLAPMASVMVRCPVGFGAAYLRNAKFLGPPRVSVHTARFRTFWGLEMLSAPACQHSSRVESSALNSGTFGAQDAEWLSEQLRVELVNGGLTAEESLSIGTACAEACQRFFSSGLGPFDPMVIMDVMEEEVERRDLRGNFLPFEIARKALRVLQRRWDGPMRPSQFLEPKDNKLDVVNFDRFPKIP